MTTLNTKTVVQHFQRRRDGVSGTAGGRNNGIAVENLLIIDAGNDIFHITFAGRRQNHFRNAGARQMDRQTFAVAPFAGVINQDGIVDAVLGVIHFLRAVGVDHLHFHTVGHKRLALFIDTNGAIERTVNRVAAQQRGALDQIIFSTALAYNHRAQAQVVTAAGFLDQQARHQTTDTAKAIQHHIAGWTGQFLVTTDQIGNLTADKFINRLPSRLAFGLVGNRNTASINMGRTQVQCSQRLNHRKGFKLRQFVLLDLTHKAVRLHDIQH